MPWPKTGATQYHEQLGLTDKGREIKGLVVCNSWDLEPLDLLNGLAICCYQPSTEVRLVSSREVFVLSLKLILDVETPFPIIFNFSTYVRPLWGALTHKVLTLQDSYNLNLTQPRINIKICFCQQQQNCVWSRFNMR